MLPSHLKLAKMSQATGDDDYFNGRRGVRRDEKMRFYDNHLHHCILENVSEEQFARYADYLVKEAKLRTEYSSDTIYSLKALLSLLSYFCYHNDSIYTQVQNTGYRMVFKRQVK